MKLCNVYERNGTIFVQSLSQTKQGFWVASGEVTVLPPVAHVAEIGSAVKDAIGRSTLSDENAETNGHDEKLLKAAKVRSWTAFGKGAGCVSIEADRSYSITPNRNLGPKGGFEPIANRTVDIPRTTPAPELGARIMDVVKRCE